MVRIIFTRMLVFRVISIQNFSLGSSNDSSYIATVYFSYTDRYELVDWLYKPFQALGAHVADYSKPVKTGEENRLHGGLPRPSLSLVDCLHIGCIATGCPGTCII